MGKLHFVPPRGDIEDSDEYHAHSKEVLSERSYLNAGTAPVGFSLTALFLLRGDDNRGYPHRRTLTNSILMVFTLGFYPMMNWNKWFIEDLIEDGFVVLRTTGIKLADAEEKLGFKLPLYDENLRNRL